MNEKENENEINETRQVTKNFKCDVCYIKFKKLVPIDVNSTPCINCTEGIGRYNEPNEFDRENADRQFSRVFNFNQNNHNPQRNPNYQNRSQFRVNEPYSNNININHQQNRNFQDHNINNRGNNENMNSNHGNANRQNSSNPFDMFSQFFNTNQTFRNFVNENNGTAYVINNGNDIGNNQRNQRNQSNQSQSQNNNQQNQQRRPQATIHQHFVFFSPFTDLNNEGINFNPIFDQTFFNFGAFPGDVFNNNFSSNFSSSFLDPLTRIIFVQNMNNQNPGNPPATQDVINKLKRIKMSETYCKKNDKGELEYPTCSVCLTETSKDEEACLLPCGHIFHTPCIIKWLEIHNNCPICRFELTLDKIVYKPQQQVVNISTVDNDIVIEEIKPNEEDKHIGGNHGDNMDLD